MTQLQLRQIDCHDVEWPEALRVMGKKAPSTLWVAGAPLNEVTAGGAVAITGSRASTGYGDRVAQELAAQLAAAGRMVVTGLAYGIDAAATRGVLAEGGRVLAVLPGGVDTVYPRAHEALATAILGAGGTLVSPYPPGTMPTRQTFILRAGLIAALSCGGVVVVEAAHRSGATTVASAAEEYGRPIMAVPGPIGSPTSYTPHRLIRERRATLVTSGTDVQEVIATL